MLSARLAVFLIALVATTPAIAEHAAEPCTTCMARDLATVLTDEPVAKPEETIELHHFVDFAPGRVRVYSKSRAKVAAIADKWKHHQDWSVITVHGFADSEPLAQRRADKIRGYLIRYGVPAELVISVAHDSTAATTDLSIELCTDCRQAR